MSKSSMYRGQLPSAVNVECGTGDTRFPQPYHPRGSKSSGQMLAVSALAADVPPDAPPADVPKAVVAAASSVRQDGKWGYILVFATLAVFLICYIYG